MSNFGVKRGLGMINPLPNIKPNPSGAVLTRDPTKEGGLAWQIQGNPQQSFSKDPSVPPLTRRATAAFTDTVTGTTTTYQDANMRWCFTLPVLPTRCRVRWINNEITASVTQLAGAVALTGVWWGLPNIATATQWGGDFTAAPTQVAPAFVTDSAGDEWVSAWFTPPAFMAANVPQALSLGINSAASGPAAVNTPLGLGYASSLGCFGANASLATNAGAAAWNGAAGTLIAGLSLGDFRLEFEYQGTNLIGLFLGDSITAGYLAGSVGWAPGTGATNFNNSSLGANGPFNRWPEKAAARLGHVAINAAVGGAVAAVIFNPFATATNPCYSRFDLATTVPDYAVISLGSNDAFAHNNTLAQFQAGLLGIVATLKAFGIKQVYAGTVVPAGYVSRPLHTAMTGGTSTSLVIEDSSTTNWSIGFYSTTASGPTTIDTGAFLTGTGVLPVTSITFASSGAVAIGALGVLTYTGATATQLNGCQFIAGSGPGGTTITATSTVKSTNLLGIEVGGSANPLWETFYPGASTTLGNLTTLTIAGKQTINNSHVVGCLVSDYGEMQRQSYNGWLRAGHPALAGVFDIATLVEGLTYGGETASGAGIAASSAANLNTWHPYFGQVGSTDQHPMSTSFSIAVGNAFSTFLHGTG